MKIKYIIAHINTIDAENGTAGVDVLYKHNDLLLWGKYDAEDEELVSFDTRKEADQYIEQVFENGMYMSYGVREYEF